MMHNGRESSDTICCLNVSGVQHTFNCRLAIQGQNGDHELGNKNEINNCGDQRYIVYVSTNKNTTNCFVERMMG